MDTEAFFKWIDVDYTMLKPDLTANFVKMMYFAQESSIAHTNKTNFPMSWYSQNKMGWAIINAQIEVYDYPSYGDVIRAVTSSAGLKGSIGERNFAIYNADGICLFKGITNWVLMDLKRRRPSRPSDAMLAGYKPFSPLYLKKDYTVPPPLPQNFEESGVYNFNVMRSDTDTNLHVNNVKYIEWAIDGIPDEVYLERDVCEMKANYKKECVQGSDVRVRTFVKKENKLEFVTWINILESDGTESRLAEIYTKWV